MYSIKDILQRIREARLLTTRIKGREQAKEKRMEELETCENKLKAEFIIKIIPIILERELLEDSDRAVIMKIDSDDCKRPSGDKSPEDKCKPEWLRGVAKLVYDACVELKLNPTIEPWMNTEYTDSGFEIVVRFENLE